MIVTVGGVSVRIVYADERTSGQTDSAGTGLPDRISGFAARMNKARITLKVTRVVGESWVEILTPEDFMRMLNVVRKMEERFPFTRIVLGGADTSETPTKARDVSFPLLAAFDTGHVSVIPHPGFVVALDHRLGRAEALVRIGEDQDWESSQIEPVLQAVLALCAPDYGALMLHAASLALSGGGYLFLGNSGAGKSTIAGSVDQGSVLSDDGSWCSRKGGNFFLFPTPFTQTDSTAAASSGNPLERILFLEKGTENRIDDISPGRAMTMLLSNHIHFFRFMGRKPATEAFGLVGELCRKHRASKLSFTRDFDPKPFFRRVADETRQAV